MARKSKAKSEPDTEAKREPQSDNPNSQPDRQPDMQINLDGSLKALFGISAALIIRMINYVFEMNIPLTAEVKVESGELPVFSSSGKTISRRRADMILLIAGERFHIEFQMRGDKTMVIRMFKYGVEIALREINIGADNEEITLTFPKQFVILLEEDSSAPEKEITMKIRLWDGELKEYKVPILRYWEESIDSLEAKHLELLIPLQIFKLRKGLDSIAKSKKTEEEKEGLIKEKLREMITVFKEVTDKIQDMTEKTGLLTKSDAWRMLESLQYLAEFLYAKYKTFAKIEEEAIDVFKSKWGFEEIDKALIEGQTKGRMEGKMESRKETAYKMFRNGEDVVKIREYAELPDEDLADVLRGLPKDVQSKYNLVGA